MADNRGVTYLGPGKVEVRSIDYPTFYGERGCHYPIGIHPLGNKRQGQEKD